MEEYISKSAVVAWIKRRMDENSGKQTLPQYFGMVEEDLNILSFIDTLEVKYLQEESVSKVWHNASERPDYNVGKTVIVGYNDGDDLDMYDECNNVAYYITLSIFVSRKDLNTRVVRWAYLKDLI